MHNTLFVMIGIAGSGKSTVAESLSEVYNAKIVSTDGIRERLCGDANCQDKNDDVYKIYNTSVYVGIRHGNIVADATNLHVKDWRKIIDMAPDYADVVACVMNVNADVAKERQKNRERKVPEDVIDKMWKTLSQNMKYLEDVFGKENIRWFN